MKAIDKIGSAFLRRILRRMKQLGVSQTELARRMNVSRPYVTKVLSRDVNFSFGTAAKLANALKMDFFPELREREECAAGGVNQTPVTAKLRKMYNMRCPMIGDTTLTTHRVRCSAAYPTGRERIMI